MATLLRRLQELSSEHLAAYRNNALAYSLKKNLGQYLCKRTVTPDQLEVQGALSSVRLTNLDFDPDVLNELLSGVSIRRLSVQSVLLHLGEVRCKVSGIDLVLAPCGHPMISTPTFTASGGPHPSEPSVRGPDESTAVLGSLTKVLTELFGLLNSYLEIVVEDIKVSLELTCTGDQKKVIAILHIPELLFRDGLADHFNTNAETAATSTGLTAPQHKIVTVNALKLSIGDITFAFADSGAVFTIRVVKERISLDTHLESLRINFVTSQLHDLATIIQTLQETSSVSAYATRSTTPQQVSHLVDTFRADAREEERVRLSELYRSSVNSMRASDPEFFDCNDRADSDGEELGSDARTSHLSLGLEFTRGVTVCFTDDLKTLREVVLRSSEFRSNFTSTSGPEGDTSCEMHATTKRLELLTKSSDTPLENLVLVSLSAEGGISGGGGGAAARDISEACTVQIEQSCEGARVGLSLGLLEHTADFESMSTVLEAILPFMALQASGEATDLGAVEASVSVDTIVIVTPLKTSSDHVLPQPPPQGSHARPTNVDRWEKLSGASSFRGLTPGPAFLCRFHTVLVRVKCSAWEHGAAVPVPAVTFETQAVTLHFHRGLSSPFHDVELLIARLLDLQVSSSSSSSSELPLMSAARWRDAQSETPEWSTARAWEPEGSRGTVAESPSSCVQSAEAGNSLVHVLFSQCTLDLALADGLALAQVTREAMSWCHSTTFLKSGGGASALPAAPQQPSASAAPANTVVCHCHNTAVATYHSDDHMPCVRVIVVDAIAGLDPHLVVALHDVELRTACGDDDDDDDGGVSWMPVLQRAPRLRAKPSRVANQDMLVLQLGSDSHDIRVASAMLRLTPGFSWATGVSDTCQRVLEAAVPSCPPAPSVSSRCSKRVVVATGEDLFVEGPQPRSGGATSSGGSQGHSQAVVEIVRVTLNTVVVSPTPPLQHISVTADQVRFLFAKDSLPFSSGTEQHFLELATLPGPRALTLGVSLHQSAEAGDGAPVNVEVDVAFAQFTASLCADSLGALVEYMSALANCDEANETDQDPSRQSSFEAATGDGMGCSGEETSCSGLSVREEDAVLTRNDDLGLLQIGEPLELLPCIEDYFNSPPEETLPPAAAESLRATRGLTSNAAVNVGTSGVEQASSLGESRRGECNHDEDDWILDGYYDSFNAFELGAWRGGGASSSPVASEEVNSSQFPSTDMQSARWYDEVEGRGAAVDVRPHHMPLPSARDTTRFDCPLVGNLVLDVRATIQKASLRLFDGSDWVCGEGPVATHVQSRAAAGTKRVLLGTTTASDENHNPGSMLGTINQSYFDNGGCESGGACGEPWVSDLSRQSTRKTDRVVSITLVEGQARYCAKAPGEGPCQYLRAAGDLLLAQSLNGQAQNCAYEWKTWRQARKEVDERGVPVKMINVEAFGFSPNPQLKHPDGGFTLDLRIRPLRIAATWDLVDFLRKFRPLPPPGGSQAKYVPPSDQEYSRSSSGLRLLAASVQATRLKVDFDTRLVDLEAVQQGDMLELLKLFPLSGVELEVQPVQCNGGTLLSEFVDQALQSWVQDITSSQLHRFVAGAGVMRPITTLGKTAANVILLPLEQYRQKNGRTVYALRRGASEFVKTVMVETLSATAALSRVFASSLSLVASDQGAQTESGARGGQPEGVQSGMASAQSSLHRGINIASHAIIAVPLENYHRSGAKGALKTSVRAVPVAVLAPVIGASEAISFALLGLRNTIDPEKRHEAEEKYRRN